VETDREYQYMMKSIDERPARLQISSGVDRDHSLSGFRLSEGLEKRKTPSCIRDDETTLAVEAPVVTVLAHWLCYQPSEFKRSWKLQSTYIIDGVVVRPWMSQPMREDPGLVSQVAYYLVFTVQALGWLLINFHRINVVIAFNPLLSMNAGGLFMGVLGKPWMVDIRELWVDASISLSYLTECSRFEQVSHRIQRTVKHRTDRSAVKPASLSEQLCRYYCRMSNEKPASNTPSSEIANPGSHWLQVDSGAVLVDRGPVGSTLLETEELT